MISEKQPRYAPRIARNGDVIKVYLLSDNPNNQKVIEMMENYLTEKVGFAIVNEYGDFILYNNPRRIFIFSKGYEGQITASSWEDGKVPRAQLSELGQKIFDHEEVGLALYRKSGDIRRYIADIPKGVIQ